MTDIFHEIEEDLRRERLRRLWDRFGVLIIALVVLIIAAAGAWSGYRYWQEQAAEEASARFAQAMTLAGEGKYAEAQAAFDALAASGPDGYRDLSLFRAATAAAAQDPAAGVKAFDSVSANSKVLPLIRDMALLRAGMLLVDTGSVADVRQRIGDLAQGTGPLRNSAREMLALAELKAGNAQEANRLATEITTDAGAPAGVRSRADLIRKITVPAVPPLTQDDASAAGAVQPEAAAPAAGETASPASPPEPAAPETTSGAAPASAPASASEGATAR